MCIRDRGAIARDPGLIPGVNVAGGKVTHEAVAEGVGAEYVPVGEVLGFDAGGDTGSAGQTHAATMETEEE